jgi:hypothetical protein
VVGCEPSVELLQVGTNGLKSVAENGPRGIVVHVCEDLACDEDHNEFNSKKLCKNRTYLGFLMIGAVL